MKPALDHASALRGVIDTINLIAAQPDIDEENLVLLLWEKGYSRIDAEKLNAFVPSAFSWPVLKKLGTASLPNHFLASDENGVEIEIPVAGQHYFTAALTLAYSVFTHGWTKEVPRKTYEAVAGRSAEMDAVNKVYGDGGSLEGTTLGPLRLLGIRAEELLEG